MEKIINISYQNRNISIEENAYIAFQAYETELKNYFAKEESGDEIMADLQNRMAEIFDEKIKNGSAAITMADIDDLKSNIGNPSEFEQHEEQNTGKQQQDTSSEKTFEKKRLYRNKFKNDKIIAGVCSGLASYFSIDPIAVRIVFVLVTLFNMATLFSFNLGILAYIILWATVPQQYIKNNIQQKLFRNPKDKVLAGVCSGLAQFFNIETWIVRSIFLLPIILGFASHNHFFKFHVLGNSLGSIMFIIYVVLWIITPVAKSSTDYMLLKGEPINLSTIQNPISMQTVSQDAKSSLNAFLKVVAYILIFFMLLLIIPTSFGFFVTGLFSFNIANIILFTPIMKTLGMLALVLLFALPLIGAIIWIVRRIAGYKQPNKMLRTLFTGLWLVGLMAAIFVGVSLVADMNTFVSKKINYPVNTIQDTLYLKAQDSLYGSNEHVIFDINAFNNIVNINKNNVEIRAIRLKYKETESTTPLVVIEKFSAGQNTENARNNADVFSFEPQIIDNSIYLPTKVIFPKNKPYRCQNVKVTIYLPKNKTLVVSEDLKKQLKFRFTANHDEFYFSSSDKSTDEEIINYGNSSTTISDDDNIIRIDDVEEEVEFQESIKEAQDNLKEAQKNLQESAKEAEAQRKEAQRNLEEAQREADKQVQEAQRNVEKAQRQAQRDMEDAQRKLNK